MVQQLIPNRFIESPRETVDGFILLLDKSDRGKGFSSNKTIKTRIDRQRSVSVGFFLLVENASRLRERFSPTSLCDSAVSLKVLLI